MSIKGVAVIVAPQEAAWHGDDHSTVITDEDGSEEQASQLLMTKFANTVLGDVFGSIDKNDAWHLWQIANKRGFRIKVFDRLPIVLASDDRDLAVSSIV